MESVLCNDGDMYEMVLSSEKDVVGMLIYPVRYEASYAFWRRESLQPQRGDCCNYFEHIPHAWALETSSVARGLTCVAASRQTC